MVEILLEHSVNRHRQGPFLHNRVDVLRAQPVEQKPDTLPLLVLPGFLANANPKIFEDVANGFARLGRPTCIVTFERWYRGSRLSRAAQEIESIGDKPRKGDPSIIQFNEAVALLRYMNAEGIEKADLAPHSLQTQTALYAIAIAPERFGNAVFVTPTALNKEYPINKLVARFARQVAPEVISNLRHNDSRRATRRHLVAGNAALAIHPMRTSWYERRTIQRTNLSDIFNRCNSDPEYPNVTVLAATQDTVFGPGQLGVVSRTYDGGHNDFIAGRLTGQIDQILTQMSQAPLE